MIKKVISENRIPIKIWFEDVEDSAIQQLNNLANLPFAFKHIAVLPDVHMGYGMPIGTVLATENVVIPSGAGSDIGCGMCAIQTDIIDYDQREIGKIRNLIQKRIPVGFFWNKELADRMLMPALNPLFEHSFSSIIEREFDRARQQLGTLGGGNHFMEIQKDRENRLWIMIHSGSRNLGKQVADFYNKEAIKLNQKWHSVVPKKWDLAFLPMSEPIAKEYMLEMQYCVDFALANRSLMMDRIKNIFHETFGAIKFGEMINIAHNFAAWENHFGKNVIVHRKGATRAYAGETGIIPGSQGTASYIVEGLGNEQSFKSCSHGAGRKMGRKAAKLNLDLETQKKLLDDQGILHGIKTADELDEAPGAYKDIDVVMNNQTDLVKVLHELKPLAVVKG